MVSSAGDSEVLSFVVSGEEAGVESVKAAFSQNGIGGSTFRGTSSAGVLLALSLGIGREAEEGPENSASSQKGLGGTSSRSSSIMSIMSSGIARTLLVGKLACACDGGDNGGTEVAALTRFTFLETLTPEGFEDGDPTLLELASSGTD